MKHLFVVAVATGIFTGTSFEAKAQTSVSAERLTNEAKTSASPKFINNIEITPNRADGDGVYYSEEGNETGSLPIVKESRQVIATPRNITAGTTIEKCSSLQFKYAMMMDMEVEAVANTALYSFIEDWWGTHYRYGGTGRDGIDCSSFTGRLVQEVYNTTLPRTARDQYSVCGKVDMDNLAEGDLVFFNTRGGVSHVGLYLGNHHFVHSSTNSGVTISSLTENYYNKRFICGGRISLSTAKK